MADHTTARPPSRYSRKHEELCDKDCPGDPMCDFTMLARLHHRESMQPTMKMLNKYIDRDQEQLYLIACELLECEPMAPVEGYDWPITYFADKGEEVNPW